MSKKKFDAVDIALSKWTRPLHYRGKLEIGKELERKPYGPNDANEMFWPVKATYDKETDMTTVDFALVLPK